MASEGTGSTGCARGAMALVLMLFVAVACVVIWIAMMIAEVEDRWQADAERARHERAAFIAALDAARIPIPGVDVDVAVVECRLYRSERGSHAWVVLHTPIDPNFVEYCTDSVATGFQDGALVVSICNFTPGAGGGCQGGGTLRTRDAMTWELSEGDRRHPRWVPFTFPTSPVATP